MFNLFSKLNKKESLESRIKKLEYEIKLLRKIIRKIKKKKYR
jgi:hypothetical protein